MADQGKDFPFKASLLSVITCSPNCLYVLWLHVLSLFWEPCPSGCMAGGVFFIIKTPKLIYFLFCGALVVIAELWIPWEGPGAAAVYRQVEH